MIKVVSFTLNGSEGLSLLPSGGTIHPARVDKVSFAVYIPGASPDNKVAVKFQNPSGSWFPTWNLTTSSSYAKLVPITGYNGWYKVSIAIKDFNTWGRRFNRINFINVLPAGTTNKFYISKLELYVR